MVHDAQMQIIYYYLLLPADYKYKWENPRVIDTNIIIYRGYLQLQLMT